MILERLARLCIGVGLMWVALVVFLGLAAGLDKPSVWFRLLDTIIDPALRGAIYLVLAVVVVPVGMLTYLRDAFGEPIPLWMKAAAPGAFVAIYALFLACTLPEVGRPLLLAAGPAAASVLPRGTLSDAPDAAWSWLARFGVGFALLAGVPGLLGLVASLLAGGGSGRRR